MPRVCYHLLVILLFVFWTEYGPSH
jgi:hypothetical protein